MDMKEFRVLLRVTAAQSDKKIICFQRVRLLPSWLQKDSVERYSNLIEIYNGCKFGAE